MSAYLNALREEGTREDLLTELGNMYDERIRLERELTDLKARLPKSKDDSSSWKNWREISCPFCRCRFGIVP